MSSILYSLGSLASKLGGYKSNFKDRVTTLIYLCKKTSERRFKKIEPNNRLEERKEEEYV